MNRAAFSYWEHSNLSNKDLDRDVTICGGKIAAAPGAAGATLSDYALVLKECMKCVFALIGKSMICLTCVLAVSLGLSACGGGGGGSAISAVGSTSPLPASVASPGGNSHQTYIRNGISVGISPDALINYYSSLYGVDDRISAPGKEFLFFWSEYAADANLPAYQILRYSASGHPTAYAYSVLPGEEIATLVNTVAHGAQFEVGHSFVLDMGASSSLTIEILNDGLLLGGNTLSMSSGYSAKVYNPNYSVNLANYGFFINAEYSALYLGAFPPPLSEAHNNNRFAFALSGGALTDYADLPTSGTVNYTIHHVFGGWTDSRLSPDYLNHEQRGGSCLNLGHTYGCRGATGNTLLTGSGSLVANFSSKSVRLRLNVIDHRGNSHRDFDIQMSIDPNRNQFHCGGTGTSSSSGCVSGGTGTYQVKGSFYGPNAEEVAGGIRTGAGVPSRTIMELGFIGKRESP